MPRTFKPEGGDNGYWTVYELIDINSGDQGEVFYVGLTGKKDMNDVLKQRIDVAVTPTGSGNEKLDRKIQELIKEWDGLPLSEIVEMRIVHSSIKEYNDANKLKIERIESLRPRGFLTNFDESPYTKKENNAYVYGLYIEDTDTPFFVGWTSRSQQSIKTSLSFLQPSDPKKEVIDRAKENGDQVLIKQLWPLEGRAAESQVRTRAQEFKKQFANLLINKPHKGRPKEDPAIRAGRRMKSWAQKFKERYGENYGKQSGS